MIRGTTPTHIFTIPFDAELVKAGKIIYAQDGENIIEKTLAECSFEGNTIKVRLTQEESFRFDCHKGYVYIQIRLLTVAGDVIASELMRVSVERCLDSEVLV